MNTNYLEKELYELVHNDKSIFEFIQKNLFDGLWYWDLENPENEWMNERFWTTLGYNPMEMPHKASAWQDIIFKEDLEIANKNARKHIENPSFPYDQTVRYKHKNGSTVWIRCYGKAIRDKNGKAIRMIGAHQDITSLKNSQELVEAKEKAESSEKRWRFALEGANDGVWDWNMATNEVFFSKQWKAMLGFKEDEIESSLDEWKTRVHPEDIEKCLADIQLHIDGRVAQYLNTHRMLCKDGTYKWILDRGKVVERDHNGKPIRMIGTHSDLTERKRVENELINAKEKALEYASEMEALNEELIQINEALASAKEKLERSEFDLVRAQRIAHLGSWYLDIATDEVEWTEELYKMYGFDPKLPPPPYTEHMKLFTAESWELLSESLAKTTKEGSPYELELKTVKKDGSNGWMWVRGEAVLNKNNNIIGLWGAAQDITKQKKTEEELKRAKREAEESEEQFRSLFENMEQGFALHKMIYKDGKSVDYEFIMLNRAFEELTSLKASDCIGKTVLQIIPNLEQVWIDNYGKVATDGLTMHFENYVQDLDKYYDVVAYSPQKGYFATVFTDVTKIKKYEQTIIKAKEDAEESNRLKSAFLANMSHEIRTPMNAITGFASFLLDRRKTREDIEKYAHIIINSGSHLLNLINDIIDISKIDAGQITVNKEAVDINSLLKELYSFFHSDLVSKDNFEIHLKLKIPKQNIIVLTDETRLRQILINLLGNAVKFTEEGEIEFGYYVEGEKLKFFVRDTGIGIPKEKQKLIFERFQQGNDKTERLYGGAGLGLSIAKACVQLLKGEIWLESELNEGSTFYFNLAYELTTVPIRERKLETSTDYSFNEELILIAEDDDINYEYMVTLLANYNLKVIRTKTGRATIKEAINNKEIKLILMDIRMPDLTGIDATIEIRKHKPDLPIIAQTAYAMNSDKMRFLEIGCNEYISKPTNKDELMYLIHNMLN